MNQRTSLLLLSAVVLAVLWPGSQTLGTAGEGPVGRAPAEITVVVPADAQVFFDGEPTRSTGTRRVFVSPPLEPGKAFHYDLLVRWKVDGKPVEETRRIAVKAGGKTEATFGKMDSSGPPVTGKGVARNDSEAGALLRRAAEGKPWQPVAAKEGIPAGDLIIGIDVGAAVVSKNGAVRMVFRGDFNGNSPLPVLETAVILDEAADVDLAVTLDRGRIDLVNTRQKGEAKVRVRVRDKTAVFVLDAPGARVTIEIYGRWASGAPFTKDLKPGDGPALGVAVLAVNGVVELQGKTARVELRAPPGYALLHGDNLTTFDPVPMFVEKLPEWADDSVVTERGQRLKAILGRFRKLVVEKGVAEALDTFIKSKDENDRRTAVIVMGALDDLPRLAEALLSAKTPDVWDAAVKALRHWIGRAPGQDQKLYHGLIERHGYKPAEAEKVMQLLHSFSDQEVAQPELYEVLINNLNDEKLCVRGLAHWHLVRLAPAGKKIAYDPLASKEDRNRAIAEWRKLIPSGKLPPEDK
jgi:uncharacterized protein (TIGR03000 family)